MRTMRRSAGGRLWPAGDVARDVWDPAPARARGMAPRDGLKRAVDLVFALLLLVPAAPIVLLAAIAVRLETPGPAVFAQTRIGRHGRRFRILKLRSLTRRAGGGQVLPGDPRVTRVGWWLRRTSLDELPQLLNVLRGEMSLVGRRPHALRDDLRFRRLHPGYARRCAVRPGLTGWAQVHGCRGPIRRPVDLDRRTRCDLAYLAGRSTGVDLLILARTLAAVVRGTAAAQQF